MNGPIELLTIVLVALVAVFVFGFTFNFNDLWLGTLGAIVVVVAVIGILTGGLRFGPPPTG